MLEEERYPEKSFFKVPATLNVKQIIEHGDLTYGYKLGQGGFGTVYHGMYQEQEVVACV